MAQLIEGQRDLKRLAREERTKAILAARKVLVGKDIWKMTQPEQTALLVALAQAAGLADENGVLLPPE